MRFTGGKPIKFLRKLAEFFKFRAKTAIGNEPKVVGLTPNPRAWQISANHYMLFVEQFLPLVRNIYIIPDMQKPIKKIVHRLADDFLVMGYGLWDTGYGILLQNSIQIHIVQNFLIEQAVVSNVFGGEPDADFSFRFGRLVGTMNQIAHGAFIGAG